MLLADVGRRCQPEPAHGAGAEVGEDVAEHVLGHEHVEARRPRDEVERGRVHVDRLERHPARPEQGAEEAAIARSSRHQRKDMHVRPVEPLD